MVRANPLIYFSLAAVFVVLEFFGYIKEFGVFEFLIKTPAIYYLALNTPKRLQKFLFWGLLLSSGGDIALTFTSKAAFLTGLGFFLFAHWAYVIAFLKAPSFSRTRVIASIAVYLLFFKSISLLTPPEDMRIAVIAYSATIATMIVATILGTTHSFALGVAGSSIFAISDYIIAFTRFNMAGYNAHVYVMVTYYLAQYLLYSSMASPNVYVPVPRKPRAN